MEIIWKNFTLKLSELKYWDKNTRIITDHRYAQLKEQIKTKGFTAPIILNTDYTIIAGHQRKKALMELYGPDYVVAVRIPNRTLDESEFEQLAIGDNLFAVHYDTKKLTEIFSTEALMGFGFERWEIGAKNIDIIPSTLRKSDTDNTFDDQNDNEPSQDQFEGLNADKGKDTNTSAPINSEEKQMPFEVLLKVSTRKDMNDTLTWIKQYYQVTTHDAAIQILLNIFNKHKIEGLNA